MGSSTNNNIDSSNNNDNTFLTNIIKNAIPNSQI